MIDPDDGHSQRWLIRAKFEPPKQDVRLVERSFLFDRLDACLPKRLGLVLAPAGFGKSSLLAQWSKHRTMQGAKVGWLSLDEADSEPLQFISYVILALHHAGLDLGSLVPLAEQGLMDGALPATISGVLEAIAGSESETILVLDDYHRISSAAVDLALSSMIGAAPPNLTIILSSRVRPRLDLSRLLAAGTAAEIDTDLLRISRQDVDKLLDGPIDTQTADLLYAKTEGWPVALQLARFLLRSDDEALTNLRKFKGDSGHIAAYLTEQVLCTVTAEQRSFLLKTSMLERFDAALADAVTGRTDSRDMLADLEHLNALLVPLGEPKSWFRYHHLFAEYLQDQHHRQYGTEVRQLHLNASDWFEQSGDLTEAVRHARDAENLARCATLIERAGGWELILLKGIGYLRNLLRNIPEDRMAQFPRIQIAQAYLHLKDGRVLEARTLYEMVRDAGEDPSAQPSLARDLLNVGALLDGYEDLRSASKSAELSAAVARQLQSDPMTIGILACEQTLAAVAMGSLSEAEVHAQEAMRAMRRAKTVLGLTYSLHHAGLVALYSGHFRVAEAHLGAASRMAVANYASDPGLKARSSLLLAVLQHWRGNLDPGERSLFLEAMAQIESFDGSFELYANGLEVECALHETSEPAIARARRIASDRGLSRMNLLADAQSLRNGDGHGDYAVAAQLRSSLPEGVWREQPILWRPYVEGRLALARYLLDRDRVSSIRSIDDVMACCRATGAVIYLIDALVLRSLALDRSGNRVEALGDLIQALSLGAPERIARPFQRDREIIPLLRSVVKMSAKDYVDVLVIEFAKTILSGFAKRNTRIAALTATANLSLKEQEVLEELTNGRSNKEIARALGLSENTVKTHLKGVFSKLKVGSRSQAIAHLAVNSITDRATMDVNVTEQAVGKIAPIRPRDPDVFAI